MENNEKDNGMYARGAVMLNWEKSNYDVDMLQDVEQGCTLSPSEFNIQAILMA